jgi:hypothetical protein
VLEPSNENGLQMLAGVYSVFSYVAFHVQYDILIVHWHSIIRILIGANGRWHTDRNEDACTLCLIGHFSIMILNLGKVI